MELRKFALPQLGILWKIEDIGVPDACANNGCMVATEEELVYVIYEDDQRYEVRLPLCLAHMREVQVWWEYQVRAQHVA